MRMLLATIAGVLMASGAYAADMAGVPIFDAHVHYSEDAWEAYPPDEVKARMDNAGVRWALVSSSPDDGTLTLARNDPDRIVPELRPYREGAGSGDWLQHPGTIEYLRGQACQERLCRHRGIPRLTHRAGRSREAGRSRVTGA